MSNYNNITSVLSQTLSARAIVSLLCFLSILSGNLATLQQRFNSNVAEAMSRPTTLFAEGDSSVSLRGEEAASWLKKNDAHDSLRASIASLFFAEDKRINASDGNVGAEFGASVAISGGTAVVGMPRGDDENTNQGKAYIFERNLGGADNWGEAKILIASDGGSGDLFGSSVAISGDTIVVGAETAKVGENFSQGAAYVFERNLGGANNWGEAKKLIASDGRADDFFAHSVAISGDTIVVGSPLHDVGENSNQGAAFVFERNLGGPNNWGEARKLVSSDGNEIDFFGESVGISNDTIVVGAFFVDGAESNEGAAYVFERDLGGANNWGEAKKLVASDGQANASFGSSVAISGDTLVVGAKNTDVGENEGQGAAYVFERNRGGTDNWGELKKLVASDGQNSENFGESVAITNDAIVVGSPDKEVGESNLQGGAYVFERNSGGTDNWGEVNNLTASDGASGDQFGQTVATNGDTIVVGSPFHDVDENTNQGSAYIFKPTVAPVIIPATITLEQGTLKTTIIATVSDDETPAGELIVEVVTTPAGISVSDIDNENGTIRAVVTADCFAYVEQNLVGLKVTDLDGNNSTANLIIDVTTENEPPTIKCPSNILALAARPGDATAVINYNQPQASDNCSQPTVVCNPPSGSAFPVGTVTTVTCTAADAVGNTAQCSFTVKIFDGCLQDDANTATVLLFNTFTGEYRFCTNGLFISGQGSVTKKGSTFTLVHNTIDRRLRATINLSQNQGSASLQYPVGSNAASITDRDIRNNYCSCAVT